MSEVGRPERLRVGVIGLGWAGQQHLAAYGGLPGVEVVALADMAGERLSQWADKSGAERRYMSWEDMIAAGGLDAVSVCTPPDVRPSIAVAALEAGLHVLCEKPLARTGDEAQRMVDTARKTDRALQVTFNYRYRSDVTVLKRHIESGALGHVFYAKARWLRRNGVPAGTGWFTTRSIAGGGALIDLGVHMLDMALYLLGEPRVVSASAATYDELARAKRAGSEEGVFDVEDLATAFLRLEGGETLTLEASWDGYCGFGDRFGVALHGAHGSAEIDVHNYSQSDTLRLYSEVAGAPAEVRPLLAKSGGHAEVVADFVAVVRSGNWERHRGDEALARARIIDACYLSAREGHEVAVHAEI